MLDSVERREWAVDQNESFSLAEFVRMLVRPEPDFGPTAETTETAYMKGLNSLGLRGD